MTGLHVKGHMLFLLRQSNPEINRLASNFLALEISMIVVFLCGIRQYFVSYNTEHLIDLIVLKDGLSSSKMCSHDQKFSHLPNIFISGLVICRQKIMVSTQKVLTSEKTGKILIV